MAFVVSVYLGYLVVWLGGTLSDVVVRNTRTPQWTVLPPFLFTLYTSNFQHNSETCLLQRYPEVHRSVLVYSRSQSTGGEEQEMVVDSQTKNKNL